MLDVVFCSLFCGGQFDKTPNFDGRFDDDCGVTDALRFVDGAVVVLGVAVGGFEVAVVGFAANLEHLNGRGVERTADPVAGVNRSVGDSRIFGGVKKLSDDFDVNGVFGFNTIVDEDTIGFFVDDWCTFGTLVLR